ncbi:nucleotide disphospho-sugar-binding domain-containing protein [Vallitalea okinawensis]|uniref:nucleotide disphospho-sugar-binding domain-containing protein n=1 Tax=Vallitalea okinawensis TaxID=2078660 RepID=UPI001300B817|nr:nucleotide disphospho-sugar-binding domain-containing protein [Vallitalea okinawensis]
MKICTFPNCAYLSETSRMIAIYKELKSRDIDVIMATHGGPYEWIFKEEGIAYHIVKPYVTNERAREFVKTNTGEKGLTEFYSTEELTTHVENEISFFKEKNISTLLTGFTLSCSISARVLSIPLAVTHLASFVPPVFERNMLVPTLLPDSKLFDLIPKTWLVSYVNKIAYRSKLGTKSFNKVSKKYNLKPFNSITEMMMGDINIVTDVPEILGIPKAELENWAPSHKDKKYYSYDYKLKYGGAIFAKLFGDVSGEIHEFLDTNLPKIYVALTSGRSDVLGKVYDAVSSLDAKAIICSTVHKFANQSNSNILVVEHLPSHKIMPMVDIAIIHGGQGSVQTAIESGTPIIGIPLHMEQGLNVVIVERNGAGIMQSKNSVTPDEIRDKIQQILNNESYKENMQRLSSHQKRVNGIKKVADILMDTDSCN